MAKTDGKQEKRSLVKKCPYCNSYVKVDARQCNECDAKLGPVGRDGIAQKPVDWKAYTVCIISWLGLFFYFWVLGWSDPMFRFFKQLFISLRIWTMKILLAIWGVLVGTWDRIMEIFARFYDWIMGG